MNDAVLIGLTAAAAMGSLIIAVRTDNLIDFFGAVFFTFLAVWLALWKAEKP